MTQTAMKSKRMWNGEWKKDPYKIATTWTNYLIMGSNEVIKKRVLDVGCGGKCVGSPFDEASSYVGVDISPVALKMAKSQKLPNAEFVLADGQHLPFRDKAFNSVFSIDTLTPLGEVSFNVLKEMCRVTNGVITFTVTHPDIFYSNASKMPPSTKLKLGVVFHDRCMDNDRRIDKMCFEENEIRSLLREMGVEPRETRVLTDNESSNLGMPIYRWEITEGGDAKSAIFVSAVRKS